MYWREGRYDQAVIEAESAIDLNPNDPAGYVALAEALIYGGHPQQAKELVEKAMQLDPHSAVNLYLLGLVHFSMEELNKAASLFERGIRRSSFSRWWNVPLAATYTHLGRPRDAQQALREWGATVTFHNLVDLWPFKDSVVAERFAVGIVRAGVCCDIDLESYLEELRNRDS